MSNLSFFENPDEVPVPRDQVAIEQVMFEPYPDGRRVRVHITLTPFLDRPNLDIGLLAPDGHAVTSLSIVEALEQHMDFTLHLRDRELLPQYVARVELYYEEGKIQDVYEAPLTIHPSDRQDAEP